MECLDVGSTNADIAGLGILLAFAIQGFISLVLSFWSVILLQIFEKDPDIDANIRGNYRLMRGRLGKVLATASDAQILTGIALLVSALVQNRTLDLYHYHIIYDTVNFTAVSFCAAIRCAFENEEDRRTSRFIAIASFSILYLTFCIIFGRHLEQWDWVGSGTCYNTTGIASPYSSHPYVDRIYLGITCFYMFSSTILSASNPPKYSPRNLPYDQVLILAMVQYPLHLYSVFALRAANEHLLSGESENTWGFGQIVALIMVGQTLIEFCRGVKEYRENLPSRLQAEGDPHELTLTRSEENE